MGAVLLIALAIVVLGIVLPLWEVAPLMGRQVRIMQFVLVCLALALLKCYQSAKPFFYPLCFLLASLVVGLVAYHIYLRRRAK